jgi:ketosteroid isomerase-like protein
MAEESTPDLVERVRLLVDAGSRGDWDEAMEFFAPDAVFLGGLGGRFEGPAIRDFLRDWFRAYEDVEIEPLEVAHVGSGVVMAVIRQSGRLRVSSSRVDEAIVLVYEWSNGLIQRVTTYVDPDEGRIAAEQLAGGQG